MLDLHVVNPDGARTVLYLHGSGSSRLEADIYASEAAELGVRLVAWNRPGSGTRPALPGRGMLAVVDDVRAALGELGLSRAPAMGLSGGASHALALACSAPELTDRVVCINPGAPADKAFSSALPLKVRMTVRAARYPFLLRQLARPVESMGRDLTAALDRRTTRASLDPVDLEVLSDPEVLGPFAAASREGVTQPGAWAAEAHMFWGRPWPFDPFAMRAPVHLFSGLRDPYRGFAEQLAARGATLHDFPGGHVSGFAPAVRRRTLLTVLGGNEIT
jgi:pimeloyl-ACP methyl ester carboxylesterase